MNKVSGGDGIPVELPPFLPQLLKEAVKLWLSQPYALWVKAYVNGNKESTFQREMEMRAREA